MSEDSPLRKRPRDQHVRRRPRGLESPTGMDPVVLVVRVPRRAEEWLARKARESGVSKARFLSRILLEKMK